jgi:protein-disulfide isomerase
MMRCEGAHSEFCGVHRAKEAVMAQDGSDLIPEPGSGDHVRGSIEAPVVITEFGDFECPYCGAAYGVLESVRAAYGDRIALVFRHFPLRMHPHAQAAAEAAEAAGSAGKFWEMYDQLYRHQNALTNRDLQQHAEAVGVDPESVKRAIEDRTYHERIERDLQSGDQSGVPGTPALYINGFAYDDTVSVDALSETIDRALAARS